MNLILGIANAVDNTIIIGCRYYRNILYSFYHFILYYVFLLKK